MKLDEDNEEEENRDEEKNPEENKNPKNEEQKTRRQEEDQEMSIKSGTPDLESETKDSDQDEEEIEIEEHPIEPIEQNEESGTATMNSFLGESNLFHCEFCSMPFSTIGYLNLHKTNAMPR